MTASAATHGWDEISGWNDVLLVVQREEQVRRITGCCWKGPLVPSGPTPAQAPTPDCLGPCPATFLLFPK